MTDPLSTAPFRILITGWRDWPATHHSIIWRALDAVVWDVAGPGGDPNQRIIVVQGECPYGGVDLYAKQWAERQPRATSEGHHAELGPRGEIRGPSRNSKMVNLGADLCLAFPGPRSRGTWDCISKAVDADIPTRVTAWCTALEKEWAEDLDL